MVSTALRRPNPRKPFIPDRHSLKRPLMERAYRLTDGPTEAQRLYAPRGPFVDFMYDHSPEVVLSGPAGTGKSLCALNKGYILACKYPGMRGLIVRKVRHSVTQSAMVMWEQKVLPAGTPVYYHGGTTEYRFPNGSRIIVGGMDRGSKVMSTEYDWVYVMEATELFADDWERLTTRCRNWVMPYQQVCGDVNPDSPQHWLYQRYLSGSLRLIETRHEDNPSLWDMNTHAWTERGQRYMAALDKLTGVRLERLRWGKWTAAEGLVYDAWDRRKHLIPRRNIPYGWRRWMVVDFGYTVEHPLVVEWWAESTTGDLYLYRELYVTQTLVEDVAREARHLSKGETIEGVICDHDAEGRAVWEKYFGMGTIAARKKVLEGIQLVNSRLKGEQGKPRLYVYQDALVRRDPEREAIKETCSSIEEVDSYVWDKAKQQGQSVREAPVKRNDHGMDCWRYIVAHFDSGSPNVTQAVRDINAMFNS